MGPPLQLSAAPRLVGHPISRKAPTAITLEAEELRKSTAMADPSTLDQSGQPGLLLHSVMDTFMQAATQVVEEHGGITIEAVELHDDLLKVQVRLVGFDGAHAGIWSLSLGQVRAHRMELGWCDVLSFSDDHPLLWPRGSADTEVVVGLPRRCFDPSFEANS
jgi:hypothetical protein